MNDNSDDNILLDDIILPTLDEPDEQKLRGKGYWGDYTMKTCSSQICFRTQVAVRCKIFRSGEWDRYIALGEDRGSDRSPEVKQWLSEKIRQYLVDFDAISIELQAIIGRMTGMSNNDLERLRLILDRRNQIKKGLQDWLDLHENQGDHTARSGE